MWNVKVRVHTICVQILRDVGQAVSQATAYYLKYLVKIFFFTQCIPFGVKYHEEILLRGLNINLLQV